MCKLSRAMRTLIHSCLSITFACRRTESAPCDFVRGGLLTPSITVKCVIRILHRTLVGRQDARTLLYNIKEQLRTLALILFEMWGCAPTRRFDRTGLPTA